MFPEALSLLLPIHAADQAAASAGVHVILSGGGSAADILRLLGFRKSVLFSAEIAERHGKLAQSLGTIAADFEKTEAVRRKLTGVLLYPLSLLAFTLVLFSMFRTHYIPELQQLAAAVGEEQGNQSAGLLLRLPDLFAALFLAAAAAVIVFLLRIKNRSAGQQAAAVARLPGAGRFFRLYWTYLFARELGSLLHSGISMQEALRYLAAQEHDRWVGCLAEEVRLHIMTGSQLSDAVSREKLFTGDFSLFAAHGEAAGHLGKELILYSEVLSVRIENLLHTLLKFIQPLFFLMIAACIIGAYMAILLPMYNLVHTI